MPDSLPQPSVIACLKAVKGENRSEKASSTIKSNVIQALMVGLIPVPLIDVVALTNIQFKMMHELVKLYDVRYTKIERAVVKSFVLGVLPVATVAGLSSTLKFMPGIGSLAGSAGVSVSAGGLTYATGAVFVRHFEEGGTLDDFDPVTAKQYFRQEFVHGKSVARKLLKRKHPRPTETV